MNAAFQPILKKIKKFRDERDWKKFHNPKDMVEAMVIEATELLELFLWKSQQESHAFLKNKKNLEEASDELADVAWFLFEFADNFGIDIGKAIEKKLQKNAKKYPISKAKGIATKYNKF